MGKGHVIWPNMEGGAVAISPAQLSYLLSGISANLASAYLALLS
ncbi:Mobile element protein (plasmid) [Sinorhizobium sp. CCBAU 05631]|nr:Mobile element protein [Sinorhizobium sp. CCBAU 05631]